MKKKRLVALLCAISILIGCLLCGASCNTASDDLMNEITGEILTKTIDYITNKFPKAEGIEVAPIRTKGYIANDLAQGKFSVGDETICYYYNTETNEFLTDEHYEEFTNRLTSKLIDVIGFEDSMSQVVGVGDHISGHLVYDTTGGRKTDRKYEEYTTTTDCFFKWDITDKEIDEKVNECLIYNTRVARVFLTMDTDSAVTNKFADLEMIKAHPTLQFYITISSSYSDTALYYCRKFPSKFALVREYRDADDVTQSEIISEQSIRK